MGWKTLNKYNKRLNKNTRTYMQSNNVVESLHTANSRCIRA